MVNLKLHKALEEEITPIICVGESKEDRKTGHEEILEEQILKSLKGLKKTDASKIIVAYEPIWAIGTGETATPKIAQETQKHCRDVCASIFGKLKAAKIPILYGGSVKPENAQTLMKQKDINGVLVGGSSLNPKKFAAIVNCNKK